MSSMSSFFGILGPQILDLLWEVIEPLEDGALMEDWVTGACLEGL